MAYSMEKGYFRAGEEGDAKKREELYGQEAICMCEKGGLSQPLYRGFCGGAESQVLGVPGARVRV